MAGIGCVALGWLCTVAVAGTNWVGVASRALTGEGEIAAVTTGVRVAVAEAGVLGCAI